MFTGKTERIKLPVGAILSDLPAKAEIGPFTGYQADVFCPRDMYNKRIGLGLDDLRDLETVKRQIEEVKAAHTLAAKKALGVKYGLDINNLDAIMTTLLKFDMAKDLPGDVLHNFMLGWGKKSLNCLKSDVLTEEQLDMVCLVLDGVVWKEYLSRTSSNTLRKIGSQIGRSITSLLQVVWYGIWVLIETTIVERTEFEIFLRAFYYFGKNAMIICDVTLF